MELVYINIPIHAKRILKALNDAGYSAYIVGGCVRDSIAKRTPHDWDICTSALPEQVTQVFEGMRILETGLKHGTVTVLMDEGAIEVTTFRTDGDYSDGRHPDSVKFCHSLYDDLSRRDFTMNAMAYHPDCGLIDPFCGVEAVYSCTIKCVGDPDQRFKEDALRILRALRFAARFRYHIAVDTLAAMMSNLDRLPLVSCERVSHELVQTLMGEWAPSALSEYAAILCAMVPEAKPCIGFEQRNPSHIYDVWQHTLEALWETPQDPILRLAVFFHDMGKPHCYHEDETGVGHFYGHGDVSGDIARSVMSRLRFSKDEIETVVELVVIHDRTIEASPKAVRRILSKIGAKQFGRLMAVRHADIMAQNPDVAHVRLDKVSKLRAIASQITVQDDCLSLKTLAVDGRDLIEVGYSAGPALGRELSMLLEAVLDNPEVNQKDTLLSLAKEHLAGGV